MANVTTKYTKPALKADLRKLVPSPQQNPFAVAQTITTRKREKIVTHVNQPLLNPQTGEVTHCAAIHKIEEMDEAHFVKVYSAGIQAAFNLTKTGHRVFQLVLNEYQSTPMQYGYADSVELYWFGSGIEGRDVGLSEYTFRRGLRELIDMKFLYPRTSSSYWVNPALLFKGNRVMFIREYRIKRHEPALPDRDPKTVDFIAGKTDEETAQ